MNKSFFTVILVAFTFTLFGQTVPAFNSLLDTATKNSGLFISAYPVKKINLNLSDTFLYRDYLKYEYNYNIDEPLLIDLINNCKIPDTTKWTESDFKSLVLVETLDEYINPKDIIKKKGLTDKLQIKCLSDKLQTSKTATHSTKTSIISHDQFLIPQRLML